MLNEVQGDDGPLSEEMRDLEYNKELCEVAYSEGYGNTDQDNYFECETGCEVAMFSSVLYNCVFDIAPHDFFCYKRIREATVGMKRRPLSRCQWYCTLEVLMRSWGKLGLLFSAR